MENLNPGPGVAVVVPWTGAASMVAALKPYKPRGQPSSPGTHDTCGIMEVRLHCSLIQFSVPKSSWNEPVCVPGLITTAPIFPRAVLTLPTPSPHLRFALLNISSFLLISLTADDISPFPFRMILTYWWKQSHGKTLASFLGTCLSSANLPCHPAGPICPFPSRDDRKGSAAV